MILDNEGLKTIIQEAADYSGTEQTVYLRKDGSDLYCAKGNLAGLKMALAPNEQIGFVCSIKPSYWPKEESDDKV